ncbi:MAG: hypothetical protein M1813_000670 [Trichoglossum hirsutum]|nr:MAG: hypothetical protein M1813_000670 [Trichoglossum hirsutum]
MSSLSTTPGESLGLGQMFPPAGPLLAQVREVATNGRFLDAIAILESAGLSERCHPLIALQESEIYMAQKDYCRASKTLDNALAHPSMVSPEYVTAAAVRDLLRLTRGFVGIFHEVRLKEAVDLAREVKGRWLETDHFNEFTELEVRLEACWHKVVMCEALMGDVPGLRTWEVESARAHRLSSLRRSLCGQRRISELMDVLTMELVTITRPPESWITILEEHLSHSLSPSGKASVHFAMAKQYYGIGDEARCAQELTVAESRYNECRHATGHLEVRYRRATWLATDPETAVGELRVVADELLKAGHPHEATNVLQSLIYAMQDAGHAHKSIVGVQAERISIAQKGENYLMVVNWLLALSVLDSGHLGGETMAGRILDLLEAALNILEQGSMPRLCATVLMTLHSYHQISYNYPIAEAYARRALVYAERVNDILTISELRCAIVAAERKKLEPGAVNWGAIEQYKSVWRRWLRDAQAQELATGEVGLAIHLLDLTLAEYASDKRADHLSEARMLIDHVEQSLPRVMEDNLRDSMYGSLLHLKAHMGHLSGHNHLAAEFAREAIAACGQDESRRQELACAWQTLGTSLFFVFNADRSFQNLIDSFLASKKALEMFEELHYLTAAAICCKSLALALFQSPDPAHAPMALEYLELAETKLSLVRRESAVNKNLDALLRRQRIRRSDVYSTLYISAVRACVKRDDNAALWLWSQRSKARALLDMLWLEGSVLPPATMEGVALRPEAETLLQEEWALVAQIEQEAPHGRYLLRHQHSLLLEKMKEFPELAVYLTARKGDLMTWGDLDSVFSADTKVVFIDWVISGSWGQDEEAYILVVRPTAKESIQRIKVNMAIADIKVWRQEYEKSRQPGGTLSDWTEDSWKPIAPLVEPLLRVGVTDPEDLLVLCPTKLLYDIPLHAIPIPIPCSEDDGPTSIALLERNPVIYCQNFSILRQSALRVRQQAIAGGDSRNWNPTVFANPTVQGLRSPGDQVGLSIAEKLRTAAILRGEATQERFRELAPRSSVLVYHGHAVSSSDDALDNSFLCLSSPSNADDPRAGRLTARNIFTLNLSRGPHVALLACQTSQQDVTPGDEAMGLIPAFLFAGATSVLGCLWPVRVVDAEAFATNLYQSVGKRSATHGDGTCATVDLARMMRDAALVIKENPDTEPAFHWAAYVLYGSNELLLPMQNIEAGPYGDSSRNC